MLDMLLSSSFAISYSRMRRLDESIFRHFESRCLKFFDTDHGILGAQAEKPRCDFHPAKRRELTRPAANNVEQFAGRILALTYPQKNAELATAITGRTYNSVELYNSVLLHHKSVKLEIPQYFIVKRNIPQCICVKKIITRISRDFLRF